MIPPSLPFHITAVLEARLHGRSQSDAAQRAAAISQTYRAGGTSRRIATADDALAYAVARMPATYAAVAASLNAIIDIRPDFAPVSLLDCGAGPGTATWAAHEAFASLATAAMLDANPALRALALDLADAAQAASTYTLGDVAVGLAKAKPADLVIASYVVNEIADGQRDALVDALWKATGDTLLVVEPGTPASTVRIIALRDRLIAQGARVVAPCPHDLACPLTPPDWCHFAQRLPRSRAHRQLKSADMAYEDEKFSYVALTRNEIARPAARLLARPVVTKIGVTSKLCTRDGVVIETAPRRDKPAYQAAKKRDWGDGVEAP